MYISYLKKCFFVRQLQPQYHRHKKNNQKTRRHRNDQKIKNRHNNNTHHTLLCSNVCINFMPIYTNKDLGAVVSGPGFCFWVAGSIFYSADNYFMFSQQAFIAMQIL